MCKTTIYMYSSVTYHDLYVYTAVQQNLPQQKHGIPLPLTTNLKRRRKKGEKKKRWDRHMTKEKSVSSFKSNVYNQNNLMWLRSLISNTSQFTNGFHRLKPKCNKMFSWYIHFKGDFQYIHTWAQWLQVLVCSGNGGKKGKYFYLSIDKKKKFNNFHGCCWFWLYK